MCTIRVCGMVGFVAVGLVMAAAGCEGIDRKHDSKVLDISPPPPYAEPAPVERSRASLPDLVEQMHAQREVYLQSITRLEKEYLLAGDVVRADWARRQRSLTEGVMVYPYLTQEAPEQRVEVRPEQSIPEADSIYKQAKDLLNQVRGVPLAGALEHNKKKARQALELFKKILREYPRSDKVDDCAFYCGEIYKEYLREDDPDDELAIRYYRWAVQLDPNTPHAARFQCAVVYDFRRHDRAKALELYHQVLDLQENNNQSNVRFAATRIEQLSDEEFSHLKPVPGTRRPVPPEARPSRVVPEEKPAPPLREQGSEEPQERRPESPDDSPPPAGSTGGPRDPAEPVNTEDPESIEPERRR